MTLTHLCSRLGTALLFACATDGSERTTRDSESSAPPPVAVTVDQPASEPRAESQVVQQARLAAPRTPFAGALSLLWQRESTDTDSILLVPNDLQFSSAGLLVFDVGDRTVRILDSRSGRYLGSLGREGGGPGEFGRVMWFLGSYEHPALFDSPGRRVTPFVYGTTLETSRPLPTRPQFLSACALDSATTFHTASVESGREIFIVRDGAIIDSLASPWPELDALNPIVRQSIARQFDAGSCVLYTLYQSRLATYERQSGFSAGRFIEPADSVSAVVRIHEDGRSRTRSLPRGTVAGPSAAAAWRDHVVLLFGGRSPHRHRVLDFYRGTDLKYVGSLLLPSRARTIAVRGDTLAVIGEKDDYPTVAAYLILRGPRR